MAQKRITQAVIFIHGIGEQRPMETLRRFVEAVLPDPPQGGEKFFSKPDRLSESFELRKLQDRSQPRTHFYEYYWAYKVSGTTFGHIWNWLSSLLFRRPGRVPKHLKPLWYLSWLLIVIAVIAAALGLAERFTVFTTRFPTWLVSAVSAIAFSLLQSAVLYKLGDAARYLSPTPANIKLRHEIRSDGIKLLRNIHESGDYDRVVLVGHSLGSVIAYDILYYYWQEINTTYNTPVKSEQKALTAVETKGEALLKQRDETNLKEYLDAQKELWWELRDLGNPWLVTDLVTLGSPLAHAALLVASDVDDLRSRQRQRELPTNPPEAEIEIRAGEERRRYSYRVWEPYEGDVKLRALHHAGLFACTRWTNLHFPAYLGLFGDIVAGPLQHWFGNGIRDIPVTTSKLWRNVTISAHSSYWYKGAVQESREAGARMNALVALATALDLDGKKTYRSS
ncbi:MAG: hypothetical protein PVG14_03435 [Anaerolineales bacterium]|jgi:hypothetical protein